MINLRFHIVSIVAVFLALALGIFTGSTLLDRATVDYLKSSRDRVDARNDELSEERDRLAVALEESGVQMEAFDAEALASAVSDELTGEQVLIVASGGLDPNSVRAVQDNFVDAGATGLGIVWIDERMDLANKAILRDVAESLKIDLGETDADLEEFVTGALSAALTQSASAPPSPPLTPGGETPDGGATTGAATPGAGYWAALATSGLIDWDSVEGTPTSEELPDSGTRLVFVSGPSASLPPDTFMYPLIRQTTSEVAPMMVGELLEPMSAVERAVSDVERGSFVDPLREDETQQERLVTIDNLDMPFGRLAAVLAASVGKSGRTGAFGEAPSASRSFPAVPAQEG